MNWVSDAAEKSRISAKLSAAEKSKERSPGTFKLTMCTVYILYSYRDKMLYTGCTNNIARRFKQHSAGQVCSTKHRLPLALIYQEFFKSKVEAFNRERFLKSLWGARTKKKILENFLDKQRG